MQESVVDLKSVFTALSGSNVLVLPDAPRFTIVAVSHDYLETTGRKREELIGKGLFEAFPNSPQDPNQVSEKTVRASLEYALNHKEPHQLPVLRYDVASGDGTFKEHYWSASNKPILNEEGKVVYLVHSVTEVMEKRIAEQQEEKIKGIQKAYHLFMNAPVIIGILQGDDYTIELANEGLLEVWARTAGVIGKPLFQALPELEGQGFKALLDEVRTTGKPFYAYQFPITLHRQGKDEVVYFDFVYKPIYDNGTEGKASGIISVGHDVTPQVVALQKEAESEAKYRTLFESMDQGFCILEMLFDEEARPVDYRFLEINPVFEKHTGLKEAAGKTVKQLLPNIEQHWIERYGKVAVTGESVHFTEGSDVMGRFFDVYAFRIGDADSRKVALLFTDITERRRTVEALRESEERFRSLADQAPMIVYLVEPDAATTMSYFNATWLQYTGQSYEEAIGRSWVSIVHPDDVQGVLDIYVPAFENRQSYTLPSVRLKRKDGEYRWHLFKGNPRYLPGGEFIGFVGIGLDIHEQKLIEDALKQSEARARVAIATAHLGTFEVNVQKQTIIHSPRNAEILGLDPAKQWPYQTIIDTLHPEDRVIRQRAFEESERTGEFFYEARVINPDGSIRWVRLNGRYVQQENQPLIIGTLMDITEERRAAEILEQKVEERTRELTQVNEQLRQFSYAASHDLQEPLRKISFFLDKLLHRLASTLNEEDKKIAERIKHTTGRMRNLIDDLLAYSNTTLGVTGFGEVSLTAIVQEVLDDMEATMIEKGAEVVLQELPVVKGDGRQLRQLFQNLVSNAIKYHKTGTAPRVYITAKQVKGADTEGYLPEERREELFHLLEVKDNGIGFDPDDAERIFRLFQRLHGKAEYEGTGVGLAIAQKVAENHRGFVWAESEPGIGATFKVLLPVG